MWRKVIPRKPARNETIGHDRVRMNVPRNTKAGCKMVREKLFTHPTKTETGEGDAELRRRKISIEMRTNVCRPDVARAFPSSIRALELAAPDFDDGIFRRDEETIQGDQGAMAPSLPRTSPGRIPTFSDAFGESREGQKM